jgi:hypothetical protein
MFLKRPKASTDQRVRSLLQKAARRGYTQIVEHVSVHLDTSGDKTWLRSRAIVITFEECWPLAASLFIDRELSSKLTALLSVTKAAKQKDAAGLGALAHAYREGDQSMVSHVPDRRLFKIASEALQRPGAFFDWALSQSDAQQVTNIVRSANQYLPAATWPWDKACILAGALLATTGDIPAIDAAGAPPAEFPFWVALDKHTPEGKIALTDIARLVNSSYRQLIWASFYCESASVNQLLPSPWWDAERTWRLGRAGLSLDAAEELWSRARPLLRQRLEAEAGAVKNIVDTVPLPSVPPTQGKFI